MSLSRVAACGFLALAAALAAGAWRLPPGSGATPGPAFFPLAIAAAMAVFSVALYLQPGAPPAVAPAPGAAKRLAGVLGLLSAYVLLWGTGLFAVRTAVFVYLLLRWTGENRKTSAGVAAGLTAVVALAFQAGLKVSLE